MRDRLGPAYRLFAPNLHGAPGGPVWEGGRRFHLADEAAALLEAADAPQGPFHLVGHSFGGALALHIAARHPNRIASLALYEPSAFHLLRHFGRQGAEAIREIALTASRMRRHFATGAWRAAAACFVDYWGGRGAWEAVRPELQHEMVRYLPKAQLDFHALINDTASLDDYTRLDFSVRLLHGEHAPFPTRLMTEELAMRLPNADLTVIRGAGHMGPLTHAETVAHAIAAHIHLADIATQAKAA